MKNIFIWMFQRRCGNMQFLLGVCYLLKYFQIFTMFFNFFVPKFVKFRENLWENRFFTKIEIFRIFRFIQTLQFQDFIMKLFKRSLKTGKAFHRWENFSILKRQNFADKTHPQLSGNPPSLSLNLILKSKNIFQILQKN